MNDQKKFYLVRELVLKAYKIGKEFRIDKKELNRFLEYAKTK